MTADIGYIQACTSGRLHDAREPSISALSRGFLYGDAVYEVWRTYHGVIFAWDEHWRRLEESAASLFMALPLSSAAALAEIKRTVAAYQKVDDRRIDYYIRLQVTRGRGAIGLDPALAEHSEYVILVQPNPHYPIEKMREGLALSIATKLRRNPVDALNPAWKTGNYLNNILCLQEARARGADEVVITNLAGEITEAAVSNIAFVRDGAVITPPFSAGILRGITRDLMIREVVTRAGFPLREESVSPHVLSEMHECFLLSTTKDLTPVSSIDRHKFRVGDETLTMRMKRVFAEIAREYANTHPHLNVSIREGPA